jgi:tRNA(Ile2) C34 agmatinyltransferase TiaS
MSRRSRFDSDRLTCSYEVQVVMVPMSQFVRELGFFLFFYMEATITTEDGKKIKISIGKKDLLDIVNTVITGIDNTNFEKEQIQLEKKYRSIIPVCYKCGKSVSLYHDCKHYFCDNCGIKFDSRIV